MADSNALDLKVKIKDHGVINIEEKSLSFTLSLYYTIQIGIGQTLGGIFDAE